eukprot:COSAG05_NODE_14089_length_408_cov_1.003236_1_plen_45_part_00
MHGSSETSDQQISQPPAMGDNGATMMAMVGALWTHHQLDSVQCC